MTGAPLPRRMLDDARLAIGFFTRLPIGSAPIDGRPFSETLWAAPVAGLAVAFVGGISFGAASWLGLQPGVAAAVALGASLLATGCLHEDGLADTADGFGGGATRERKLEIMRDSRIGTYGVSALAVALLLRWSALSAIAEPGPVAAALVASEAASRATLPAFMHLLPNARADGLSAGVGAVSRDTALWAGLLGAAALFLLGPAAAIIAALLLALWFQALRHLALAQIGGRTGDVLGALQQGGAILVLLVASVSLR